MPIQFHTSHFTWLYRCADANSYFSQLCMGYTCTYSPSCIILYMHINFIVLHSTGVLINPRRACAGGLWYLSCLCVCLFVCVSVCYHSSANIARFYIENEVHTYGFVLGFSRFLTRGFSINPDVNLWREKRSAGDMTMQNISCTSYNWLLHHHVMSYNS